MSEELLARRLYEDIVRSDFNPISDLPVKAARTKQESSDPPAKPASKSAAHEILREAATIVAGDRNATHGEKERSFVVIANLWNAYLNGRKNKSADVSARDVAQLLVLLKIGRSIQGSAVPDHFLDQAGYSAIAGELSALETVSQPG